MLVALHSPQDTCGPASGATRSRGVTVYQGLVDFDHLIANGSGGGRAYGLFVVGSSITATVYVRDSQMVGKDETSEYYGAAFATNNLNAGWPDSWTYIRGSELKGDTRPVLGYQKHQVHIALSKLISSGTPNYNGTHVRCATVYDENYTSSSGPSCP
jgi:hypothetical protein